MSETDPHDLDKRVAAYTAFLDAVATESQYWLLGKREDPDQIHRLSEAVRDPSTLIEPKTPTEGP